MEVTAKNDKVNSIVAQFNYALGTSMCDFKQDVKKGYEKIEDPNCKVFATKYLQLHREELIGNTLLHLAAIQKNLDAIGILLNLEADYTVKNHKNLTVLHQIIENEASFISEAYKLNDTLVDLILSAHLKNENFENPLNDNGLSHFHIACAFNNVEFIKAFVQNGISVDHTVKENSHLFPGFTPLHFAARFFALEVVQILLSHGANRHIKNVNGLTPLHLALEQKLKIFGKSNINEALRDKSDKILELLSVEDGRNDVIFTDDLGLSRIHVACTFKDTIVAESLLQKVVNIDHAVKMDSSLWPGYTPLHFAALCNIDTVKLLMKKGADINIADTKGVTPFDICIERYRAEDIYAVISLNPIWKNIVLSDGKTRLTDLVFAMRNSNQFNAFLKKFSKNISICHSPLWPGYTPMHLAVLFAKEQSSTTGDDEEINIQILRILCEKNPNMFKSQDVHGYTPLHLAFQLNKKPLLDVLFSFLESYPDMTDHIDEDGLSIVHIASYHNKISLLKRMLSIDSDVNAIFRGKSLIRCMMYPGSTALHFAVLNGSVKAVNTLVEQGADVYAKDFNDMTPIHLLLFNSAADSLFETPDLRDSLVSGIGLSHLHALCWFDMPEIVEWLLDNGADINGVVTYKPNVSEDSSVPLIFKKYAGYSPLLMAYKEQSHETVQLLLERGADIFVENSEGKALLYSIINSRDDDHLQNFVEAMKRDDDVKARLRADTGMTDLHIACLFDDYETAKKLISEGADINNQVRPESPIFQGFTPLHISSYMSKIGDVGKVIELLVKNGADVTLYNAESNTGIHVAHEVFEDNFPAMYTYLNIMLEAQRDFSLNPVNASGLTHFHVACNIFNTRIVEKFLEYADIDVNQPIDYFDDDSPGYTALHLAATHLYEIDCDTFSEQLNTIDLLLKHGADVNVEDAYGDTPLFNCFRMNYHDSESLDIFERIARAGVDVNARNLSGHTPFYYYLETEEATTEGLKTLLRMGCHLNAFHTVTNHGYIAKILFFIQHKDLPKLFTILTTTFKQQIATDNLGRTAIHNIVSDDEYETSEIASYIDQLSNIGITVDDQDNSGKTALHTAAKFHNSEGIAGLLMAGADINVCDLNGKTAFAYDVGTCVLCRTVDESADESIITKCAHRRTLETLATHVKKLQLVGLDVNKQNEDLASKTFEKFEDENLLNEDIFKELETVKNTAIGSQSFTLHEFLSETGAVAKYPRMSSIKRDAINKCFSPNEVQSLRGKFPELAGILQLQYRKARARPRLIELAGNALAVLAGFRLPEICSDCIFVWMTNSELINLVESNANAGNAKSL